MILILINKCSVFRFVPTIQTNFAFPCLLIFRGMGGNLITCHLRLTLCHYINNPIQMWIPKLCKWYETGNMIGQKGHSCIYHIVIYAWHKTTDMWNITAFPQIFHASTWMQIGAIERYDVNQITIARSTRGITRSLCFNMTTTNVHNNKYFLVSICSKLIRDGKKKS